MLISSGPTIEMKDFCLEDSEPPATEARIDGSSTFSLREVEKDLIFKALDKTEGNRTQAAHILGISVRTLRNKLQEYKQEAGSWAEEGLVPIQPPTMVWDLQKGIKDKKVEVLMNHFLSGRLFDRTIHFLEQSLNLRGARQGMLTGNIANAETPDYSAKDLPFQQIMRQKMGDSFHGPRAKNTSPTFSRAGVGSGKGVRSALVGGNRFLGSQYRPGNDQAGGKQPPVPIGRPGPDQEIGNH